MRAGARTANGQAEGAEVADGIRWGLGDGDLGEGDLGEVGGELVGGMEIAAWGRVAKDCDIVS